MGIPNAAERLAEIETLLAKVPPSPELAALLDRWWVRNRPDHQPCQRCVLFRMSLKVKSEEADKR